MNHSPRLTRRSSWCRAASTAKPDRWRRVGESTARARASSGRTYLTGWPDRDPVIPGAVPYGDVIVPYCHGGAVCAALQHRRESGPRRAHRCIHVRDLRPANARRRLAGAGFRCAEAHAEIADPRVFPPGSVCRARRGSMDRHCIAERASIGNAYRRVRESCRSVEDADRARCGHRRLGAVIRTAMP